VYFMHDTGNRRIAGYVNFVLRTSGPPSAAAGDVRAVLQGIDRSVIIDRIDPLTTLVARSVARPRFGLTIMSTFAALALVLAAVGLYGALSYGVSQRRRELGVRAALGADRGRLVALVLREGLAVVAAGTLVGVVAAALLTRTMQTLLFGISPFDLLSYASALFVLLLAALVAALVPAWRAATTDPAAVLRA
jgi:ABC-type antimicrobial peptide transport system permease subunit